MDYNPKEVLRPFCNYLQGHDKTYVQDSTTK